MARHDRRLAGIGSIAFAAFMLAGFIVANTPGGEYHANDVADFVAHGHRSAVIISVFLVALSALGLIIVMAYLCETCFGEGRHGRIAWGTALVAAASFLIGWAVAVTPATSLSLGGGPSTDPTVSYTIMQAGFGIVLVVGCLLLGISFLTFAIGAKAAPTWVRAFTGLVGVLALCAMAFFPFFAVLLWGIVIGVWLLVSSPTGQPNAAT